MNSRPHATPMLWLLAAALALSLWAPGEIHPDSRLTLAALAALLSCWIAGTAFRESPGQAIEKSGGGDHRAAAALAAGGLLASSALSLNPYRSVHTLAMLAGAAAFYMACRRWAARSPRLWLEVFLSVCALVALYACLQAGGGLEQTLRAALQEDPELPVAWRARLESGRVFGTLLLPATLGGLMGMAVPVAAGLAGKGRAGRRVVAGLAGSLCVAALALSRSYGALLAVSLAAVWALGRLPARRAAVLRTCVLGAAVAAILIFSSARHRSAGQRLLEPQGPVVQRWLNWKTAAAVIGRYPALGCGPGAYASAFVGLRQEGENDTRFAHSTPLQATAEAGLWVLLPLGLGLAGLYPRLRRALRGSAVEAGVATGVMAFLLHNLVDFTAYLPSMLWAAAALAALLPGEDAGGAVGAGQGADRPSVRGCGSANRTWVLAALAVLCLASLGPVGRQWRGEALRERAREAARQPDGRMAADRLYEAAVRADPHRADLRLEYAQYLLARDSPDAVRAIDQAGSAARLDRGSALAHDLLSRAWVARQEWTEAYVHAERAVAIHPRSKQARAWLERLREQLDAGRP